MSDISNDAELARAEFGFPGPLRDRLVAAVLSGAKTSTTGLHEWHLRAGERLPRIGDRQLVIDSQGRGVAVLRTTGVEVKPMRDVDLQFAIDEGEGFETVADWAAAHVRFFTCDEMVEELGEPPVAIGPETKVVCERFEVVERR